MSRTFLRTVRTLAAVTGIAVLAGCIAATGDGSTTDPVESLGTATEAIKASELSTLVLGGVYPVTNGYQPNRVHAGIDFGGTGDGVTAVSSPVIGTIIANTGACGKVAIYDGQNTVIMAHMTDRTSLGIGAPVDVGTYLGRASKVVGGGCTATGAHLHLEIRTGYNANMANPTADNRATTLDPLSYTYGPFPPVALIWPADRECTATNPTTFTWSSIQGASSYRLQVSATNSFDAESCLAGCTVNQTTSGTSLTVSLPSGETYFWRVRAGNSSTGQGGRWSPVRSFAR